MNASSAGALFRSRPVPLASFTAVMGLIGTGLDLRTAYAIGSAAQCIGECVIALGIVVFAVLAIRWVLRIRSDRSEIQRENANPSTAHFLGTIWISFALTAAAIAPYCVQAAQAVWLIAAVGAAVSILYLAGRWIEKGLDSAALTPAIFLPVVGNAATVYVAGAIGVEHVAWFSFSLALVSWLGLLPVSLYRLVAVQPPLPRKIAPQLAVLVASPAVLANAWFVLNDGHIDPFFVILACASLFFALLTIRLWRMAWGEPFNVAMWGWTFPAAALAGSFERIALVNPSLPTATLALVLLWLAIGVTAGCSAGAVLGWIRRPSLNPNWSPS